jgi:hypothetical protein
MVSIEINNLQFSIIFFIELVRKLNNLEEILNDRNGQLHIANEQRRDYDRIANKLNEWIRNAEQHVKDPLTNDLQQPVNGLREKSKTLQVREI